MIARRNILAVPIALAATARPASAIPPLPIPSGNRIAFQLRRNGDVIGRHELTFASEGTTLTVSIALDIVVKFGPIAVYRYQHRGTERWRDGRFVSMESKTDSDGTPQFMRAAFDNGSLVVEGSQAKRYTAPPGTLVSTYWNKAMLQPHLISSEDGKLFDIAPHPIADEAVPIAGGGTIKAQHWKLDDSKPLDLWYDPSGQWAHLRFTKDGSTIIYERL